MINTINAINIINTITNQNVPGTRRRGSTLFQAQIRVLLILADSQVFPF